MIRQRQDRLDLELVFLRPKRLRILLLLFELAEALLEDALQDAELNIGQASPLKLLQHGS